ncbi:hypothetical protein OIE91_11455 [Streptomyces albidoflavus]|uniref:hypothetical protein n=1 Tax=Streptomyces albidoflavus TaxID=1886 RepID=UPI00352BFE27
MTTAPLTPDLPAQIAAHLDGVRPAGHLLVASLAESVADRRTHQHPKGEDLYCHNLASWAGERVGPVLRRLIDAETERDRLRVELDKRTAQHAEVAAALAEQVQRSGQRMREHDADREELERLRAELAAADTSIFCDAEGHAVPHSPGCPDAAARTERDRWQALTDALNAVNVLGIDLDGTLTDHADHSVVWDRDAKRWALARYDD